MDPEIWTKGEKRKVIETHRAGRIPGCPHDDEAVQVLVHRTADGRIDFTCPKCGASASWYTTNGRVA